MIIRPRRHGKGQWHDQDQTAPPTPATIFGILGHEPNRKDEYPMAYMVGSLCGPQGNEQTTSRISYREIDYGDHRLGFFDIFVEVDGEEQHISSMAARAIAEIHYVKPS